MKHVLTGRRIRAIGAANEGMLRQPNPSQANVVTVGCAHEIMVHVRALNLMGKGN